MFTMKIIFIFISIFTLLHLDSPSQAQTKSQEFFSSAQEVKKCKSAAVNDCYAVRGALGLWNGGCTHKIHVSGTKHLLCVKENLPEGLTTAIQSLGAEESWNHAFAADFEVCPLVKEKPGTQGYVCVLNAKDFSIQKRAKR